MPKHLTCDKCGKEPAQEEYDGSILCEYHRAKSDLFSLKREYQEKKEWIEKVWISKLKKMEEEINELEIFIKAKGGEDE